jgi:hypothetical protein
MEFLRPEILPQLTLLDNILDIHAAVLRMFMNMNRSTRVVFLAQNALKRNAFVKKESVITERSSRDPWIHFSDLGWLNLRQKLALFPDVQN